MDAFKIAAFKWFMAGDRHAVEIAYTRFWPFEREEVEAVLLDHGFIREGSAFIAPEDYQLQADAWHQFALKGIPISTEWKEPEALPLWFIEALENHPLI